VLLTAAMAGARIDEESMLARRSITILVVRPLRIISL